MILPNGNWGEDPDLNELLSIAEIQNRYNLWRQKQAQRQERDREKRFLIWLKKKFLGK